MTTPHPHDKANLSHYLDVMTRAGAGHGWTPEPYTCPYGGEVTTDWHRMIDCPIAGAVVDQYAETEATQADLDALLGSCVRWLEARGYQPSFFRRSPKRAMCQVLAAEEATEDYAAPTPLAACIDAMESILEEKE
jgi:hypothetical protein